MVDDKLKSLGVTVKMGWIPSHCGIPFNELADSEAKKAAECGNIKGSVAITLEQAKTLINKEIKRSGSCSGIGLIQVLKLVL